MCHWNHEIYVECLIKDSSAWTFFYTLTLSWQITSHWVRRCSVTHCRKKISARLFRRPLYLGTSFDGYWMKISTSIKNCIAYSIWTVHLKMGLHRNANRNAACENEAYVRVGKFVDCSAFAEAANRPYINVLYANSFLCTDSRRIAFGCSPNVCHTAECSLPRLRNTFTSNIRIVFACCVCVCILFAFQCKCSFIRTMFKFRPSLISI